MLLGAVIGIPTAWRQKLSLYLHFGRWFRGWLRANTIAWILGGVSIMAVMNLGFYRSEQPDILIQILSLMLPPTLAQIWVLRRHVQNAWLMLLAAIAGT